MIAFIPARGGSKGLKNKNVKIFNKKPLIFYTIKAALKSKYISEVYVLTDSKKISKISKKFGAKVPFLRPKNLSTDKSHITDTYKYTLKKLNLEKKYKNFIALQPTSPLRGTDEINSAIKFFLKNKAYSMISVSKNKFPKNWMCSLVNKKGVPLLKINNKYSNRNRQDYKSIYIPNGSIYLFNIKKFLKNGKYFYRNKTLAYVMSEKFSISYNDIDNLLHFKLSEFIYNNKKIFN